MIVEAVESEKDKVVENDHDKNGSNEAFSSKFDEVDKTNAVLVKSKDERIDTIAKGVESQNDNVAHSDSDENFGTKTDAVAENKSGKVPQ